MILEFIVPSTLKYLEWVELGCEWDTAQSQYLFSDDKHMWDEARAECKLYGGWLVSVESQWEYNCLLRYGNAQGYHSWFWTDGNIHFIEPFIKYIDIESGRGLLMD